MITKLSTVVALVSRRRIVIVTKDIKHRWRRLSPGLRRLLRRTS